MPTQSLLAVFSTLVVSLWGAGTLRAQADRFARFEPGLIVETGARMGACDVITFTPDGHYVMAVGDDKVVRIWEHTERGIDPRSVGVLRWSIFREQRGNIYALAISPDKENRLVAVGGLGVRAGAGTVALLDRRTGEVKKALADPQANEFAVWCVAFSPSGDRIVFGKGDGQVGVWDLKAEAGKDIIRLGRHERSDKSPGNKVRLVAFPSEDQVVSVAEDGQLLQWNVADPKAAPKVLHRFGTAHLWQARIDPQRRVIGVISQRDQVKVAVYSLTSGTATTLQLADGAQPHSLALDAAGERLAVATWTNPLLKEKTGGAQVRIFDLRRPDQPPQAGPRSNYYMDALAFAPSPPPPLPRGERVDRLAIAGGADHEVTLWDLKKPAAGPISKIVSAGSCLWGAAFSKDGRYVGFLDQVDIYSTDVNKRGKGAWRVFDLQKRTWAPPAVPFESVRPIESAGGWKLQFTADPQVWNAVSPSGTAYSLPLDPGADALPRCYTFLPGTVPRVAVGHFWGVSIFELTKDGPRRSRLMHGHQGEVMAVAPSTDGKLLITASRDQTLAAWSLSPWPTQAELGARFLARQGKVTVDEVDPGSPAWEAGLAKGDEVTLLAFAGKKVEGGAEAWLARLQQPVPGKEHYFALKRPGQEKPIQVLTRSMQRPLWQFFPTRGGEWVLWRWRDYFYDSSTNGDSYIGWQVSGDISTTPAFYKAEQFRKQFYRPDKVGALLVGLAAPERVSIPDIEPPDVRLQAAANDVKDSDLTVTLTAKARSEHTNHRLERVLLWVNDFQFQTFKADGVTFEKTVTIPRDKLRRGPNLLTLQCYNRAEVRGEAPAVSVECSRPLAPPKLFGLLIGVGDYSRAKHRVPDLNADRDAEAMAELWQEQKKRYFGETEIQLLVNRKATPQEILARLQALAQQAKPDDQLVLFLAGHGTAAEEIVKLVEFLRKKRNPSPPDKLPVFTPLPPGSFAFLGPEFNPLQPYDSCLTSQDLYLAIARLPCHKLVLLDTCHSGTLRVNPVRELTRDGVGPVIVTACAPDQQAMEYGLLDNNRSFGLFTMAVRRALTDEFGKADTNKDGKVDATELVAFIKKRVPEFVQQLKDYRVEGIQATDMQLPTDFLPRLEEKLPLAAK
jgi:WD40 repeat protein